ncbi:hypothetical protein ACFCX4_00445 [Kitasatospora sp. NPDC056327]|uniref:hypothetical protein n=1 Tax=Kitasatospora sp. NPDC056327 TaxID=3345785 RepID=UPI0035D5EFDC
MNGSVDLPTVADRPAGPSPLGVEPVVDGEHPRVVRALRHHEDVRVDERVFGAQDGLAVLVLVLVPGRGVASRRECAAEGAAGARGRGPGRVAARHPVPEGGWARSRRAPGNATSVRAVRAAGHRPVGTRTPLLTEAP